MTDAGASVPLLDFKTKEDLSKTLSSTSSSDSVKIEVDELECNIVSLLHRGARDGNVDTIGKLTSRYPELVNVADSDGFTALHYAAKYGHVKAVELLLNKGATVDIVGRDQFTPLHLTAKYCRPLTQQRTSPTERSLVSQYIDLSAHSATCPITSVDVPTIIVDLLVDRGADVNARDSYGLTPLHHAAMKGNQSAARALIKHRADVNAKASKGTTPLLTACVHGSDEIIQMLLLNGADTSETDKRMNSVYHIAALHGRCDTLNLLLQHGGPTCQRMLWASNNEGKTPLRMAVDGNHPDTVTMILKLQPENRSTFDVKDKYLLHEAAAKGYVEVAERLIQNGYDPRLRDDDLQLPLHWAAQYDRVDVAQLLVTIAPDCIEERDEAGMPPFLTAVGHNALGVVKVLIEHGTDIFVTDDEGRTAIHIGAKFNAIKVLTHILDLCRERRKAEGDRIPDLVNQPDHSQMTPMHIVCSNGYIEVSRVLYQYGAALDALDEDEETPLLLAARKGETISVRQLLEWDKRLVLHKNDDADTALHLAAKYGKAETTKVLLDAGADIEAKNSHEDTALQCAVDGGHLNTVHQLLERHAVLENKDDLSDSTPLHLASAKGHDAIVRLLLESGATINRRDENGKTALDLAIENGHREVARVLVESDDWMSVLSPSDTLPIGRHNLSRVTPLRKLIEKFPDIAEIVFCRCISDRGDSANDFYFFREYNFALIDDTYMMPSKDGTELLSSVSPYNDDGTLKQNAKAYSDDYDVVYKNHPLKIMAQSEILLSHPLVQALLKHKWNSLGRYVYYFALGVYLLFLCTFTMYVTHTPPPFNVYDETTKEMRDLTDLFNSETECPNVNITRPPWLATCRWIVISLAIAQLFKELFQLITRRYRYISFENALECFIYSSAIISLRDLSPCSETTGIRMNWQWLLAAACAFSSWMNLLLLIRKLPRFGIYVVMFFDVLRTFSRFFIVFALFVIAFSIAFFVIMQNRPEFSSVPSSVLKTTVMMIGEFEFTAIFHGDADVHPERLFGHAIAYPLFLFFCVIMTILLMNLLVGLAVDDIKSVLEEAKLKRLSMQADLVLQVEASMPYIRKLTCRSSVRVYPNQTNFFKRLRSRFGFDSSTVGVLEEEWESKEEELFHEFRQVVKDQNHQLHKLQRNVDVMYSEQVKTAAMLRAVMERLEVNFQETVKD